MAGYSRQHLSGSTNGRAIKVAATATPGTAVHTAIAGTTGFDEVYLWASNTDSAERTLTVEWGGTTAPDDHVAPAITLPPNSGPVPIVTGQCLNNGLAIKAFSDAANKVLLTGYVNRIS